MKLDVSTVIKVNVNLTHRAYDANERLNVETGILYGDHHIWSGSFSGRYHNTDPVKTAIFKACDDVCNDPQTCISLIHDHFTFEADTQDEVDAVVKRVYNYLKRLKEYKENA